MLSSGCGIYLGISFQITYKISVLRLSQVQCEGGGIKRGTVKGLTVVNLLQSNTTTGLNITFSYTNICDSKSTHLTCSPRSAKTIFLDSYVPSTEYSEQISLKCVQHPL
jgi:hypothetical protein